MLADKCTREAHTSIRSLMIQKNQYMLSRYIGAVMKERNTRLMDMHEQANMMDPLLP